MAKTNESQKTAMAGTNRKHGLEKKQQGGAVKQERQLAKQTTTQNWCCNTKIRLLFNKQILNQTRNGGGWKATSALSDGIDFPILTLEEVK